MTTIKIDLSKIDSELSKRLDDVREKVKALDKAAYDLHLYLDHQMTAECVKEEENNE